MAKFGEQLATMFKDICDKIDETLGALRADAEEKTEQIISLREELRDNLAEQTAIVETVMQFANTVYEKENSMTVAKNAVAETVEILDELGDDSDRTEIGVCPNCGLVLYEGDDTVEGEDGTIFCSDECREQYETGASEDDEDDGDYADDGEDENEDNE